MTKDELAAFGKDCGLPLTPTPLTAQLRRAASGVGPLASEWADKPHRLLYDACAEIERLNDLLETGKLVLIDDGAVERMAQGMWASVSSAPWEQGVTAAYQDGYRCLARAALSALGVK